MDAADLAALEASDAPLERTRRAESSVPLSPERDAVAELLVVPVVDVEPSVEDAEATLPAARRPAMSQSTRLPRRARPRWLASARHSLLVAAVVAVDSAATASVRLVRKDTAATIVRLAETAPLDEAAVGVERSEIVSRALTVLE